MATEAEVRDAFAVQARWCRDMDAPRSAAIVAALPEALGRTTAVGRAVLSWPGEPVADALALRLLGGLHALARASVDPGLAHAFASEVAPDALIEVLTAAIRAHDATLLPWLAGPPQTNEVARSAALMTGLLHLAAWAGPRMELLEVGSSAGLNLALGHYRFRLGDATIGPADAGLTLAPEWRGAAPPAGPIEVVSVRGVDVTPVDPCDDAALDRLHAYVWADHDERRARLAAAAAIARSADTAVERGDAAEWLEARLAEPQAAGVTRVLVHSIMWQYLPASAQERIEAAMAAAGDRATRDRPLGWAAMEPAPGFDAFEVRARGWPDGGPDRVVALTHPHARWIEGLPALEPG